MRASYGAKIFMALIGVGLVLSLSTGGFAAEDLDSLAPLVVPEPNSVEQTVAYLQDGEPTLALKKTVLESKTETPDNAEACGPTCVSCQPGCCNPGPHWVAGVEAVWLSPQQNDQAATFAVGPEEAPVDVFSSGPAEVKGLYITPRIWLGLQGEHWGVMARYWRMCEPGGVITPVMGGCGPIEDGCWSNAVSIFKAETFDIEGTRLFCWGKTRNILSFGARYAELRQETGLAVRDVVEQWGLYSGSAFSRHHVSGAGITAGWAGLKPLGCDNLHLFYNLRGSLIWDDGASNYYQTTAFWLGQGVAIGGASTLIETKGTLFIGEIQLGVQWNFELSKYIADAFFRFAVEYQYWDTSKTGSGTQCSYAGPEEYLGVATATAGDAQVDLIGFTIATGFTW
ncbi:MAG: hypothetical protein JXB10_11520 [Pirellulales bacterium]|nr:hypothetical protein [Pirellulales bacterium]